MAKKTKEDGKKKEKATAEVTSTTPVEAPRKRKLYHEQAAAALKTQFSYKNPMQIPSAENHRQHGARRRGR
jgi:hypothetical protein